MATWTSLAFLAGAYLAIRNEAARQTRIVRSTAIRAPANRVFDVVADVARIPEWCRRPQWFPRGLGFTTLARWGEHVPQQWRVQGAGTISDEIRIRCIRNREFSYICRNRHGLSYECNFRIASMDRECALIWELRYKNPRWLDAAFNRAIIARATAEVMARSLETITRVAEAFEAPAAFQEPKQSQELPLWPHEVKAS